jgi:hypothetical protein
MMDCLGLLGENPIMPPPPKVFPVRPVVDSVLLELLVVLLLVVLESVVDVDEKRLLEVLLEVLLPEVDVDEPASGCPKNPMAVGHLFWPNRIGFQSSLPVVGSTYFLRKKRILLVGLTSASMLDG